MSDTLDAILRACEALLAEGEADPGSVWRNPTLVTTADASVPQARTVVLRRFRAPQRAVETHTDTRSAKYRELLARPSAGLHAWDSVRQIQLRLTGCVTLHTGDSVADEAWAALRPQSRATYRVQPGPGTVLAEPERATEGSEAEARAVFCVVALHYSRLEYLLLAHEGHRRARFTWSADALAAEWLTP